MPTAVAHSRPRRSGPRRPVRTRGRSRRDARVLRRALRAKRRGIGTAFASRWIESGADALDKAREGVRRAGANRMWSRRAAAKTEEHQSACRSPSRATRRRGLTHGQSGCRCRASRAAPGPFRGICSRAVRSAVSSAVSSAPGAMESVGAGRGATSVPPRPGAGATAILHFWVTFMVLVTFRRSAPIIFHSNVGTKSVSRVIINIYAYISRFGFRFRERRLNETMSKLESVPSVSPVYTSK